MANNTSYIQPVVKMCSAFTPLWTSDKRYFLLTGGRGSLKSTHVHYFLSDLLEEVGHGVLFTRYTMTSAETSIIPEFRTIVERLGRSHKYHFTKTRVTNKATGSFIVFSGIKTNSGDQTAKLKSISGITTFVVEEGEDFNDEKTFDTINYSVRTAAKQNRVIWIQNPSTKQHFIYQRWIKDTNKKVNYYGYDVTMSTHPKVEHIHTTYHIAKEYLSPEILAEYEDERIKAAQMENKYDSKFYQVILGGWREQAEGVIFTNWSERPFPSLPSICGLDYGYNPDPLALIRVATNKSRKEVYLDELIYQTNLSNELLLNLIRKRTRPNELIITDINEPRTNEYLKQKNINVRKVKKRGIVERIKYYKDWKIYLTPRSINLKEEFNEYAWNDKKSDTPIDDFNHGMDGWMYAADRLVGL